MQSKTYSLAVHSFNEAEFLERLIRSALSLRDSRMKEIVVMDHRSDDGTSLLLDSFESGWDRDDLSLIRLYEERDFGPDFKFADIRQATASASSSDFVSVLDADFILGPGFKHLMTVAMNCIDASDNVYAAGYPIPVVNGMIETDRRGRVLEHGTVQTHPEVPRILRRESFEYRQDHCDGMFEWCHPMTAAKAWVKIPRANSSIVSCNIKERDYRYRKVTMCTFQKMIAEGTASGNWLDNFETGTLTEISEKHIDTVPTGNSEISGEVYYAPNMKLAGEAK